MKINSGCEDCKDRFVGCHGSCEKYKAYKDLLEEAKKDMEIKYGIDKMFRDFEKKKVVRLTSLKR